MEELTEELIAHLESEGFTEIRLVPDRGICGLKRFMFTIGLVYDINPRPKNWEDWYSGRYCYPLEHVVDAIDALNKWDGEEDPEGGWIKHKGIAGEWGNSNR